MKMLAHNARRLAKAKVFGSGEPESGSRTRHLTPHPNPGIPLPPA